MSLVLDFFFFFVSHIAYSLRTNRMTGAYRQNIVYTPVLKGPVEFVLFSLLLSNILLFIAKESSAPAFKPLED